RRDGGRNRDGQGDEESAEQGASGASHATEVPRRGETLTRTYVEPIWAFGRRLGARGSSGTGGTVTRMTAADLPADYFGRHLADVHHEIADLRPHRLVSQ